MMSGGRIGPIFEKGESADRCLTMKLLGLRISENFQ